jgi:hypothetical protein
MSDDESITTEDMNQMINEETFEEVEVKGVERKTHTKKVPVVKTEKKTDKKPKEKKITKKEKEEIDEYNESYNVEPQYKKNPKKPMSEAKKAAIEKLVENNKKRAEQRKLDKEQGKPVKETKPKTHTKEIIHKEKIIYMIPDNSGGYKEVKNPPKLTKKDIKKHENELEVQKQEELLGRKLVRKKNGTADKRSSNTKAVRSPAQIAASKKLVEMNKKKKEDRLKAAEQKEKSKFEDIKEEISDTIINVVSKPIQQVKEERKAKRPVITDEEKKAYERQRRRELFS